MEGVGGQRPLFSLSRTPGVCPGRRDEATSQVILRRPLPHAWRVVSGGCTDPECLPCPVFLGEYPRLWGRGNEYYRILEAGSGVGVGLGDGDRSYLLVFPYLYTPGSTSVQGS